MDEIQQLEKFAHSSMVNELVSAGRPFLKTSAAAKVAKSDLFRTGLKKLAQCGEAGTGGDQLLAIAFAWRITAVTSMKDNRRFLLQSLQNDYSRPSVPALTLLDPDDRKYLGEALRWKSDDWVAEFLVQSIANEKDGKQARLAFCETLLTKQTDLASSLREIGTALKALSLDQKDKNLGRAKQLINILQSLSEAVWNMPDDLNIGDDLGDAYSQLLNSVVSSGEISERFVRVDLAKNACEFFIVLTRLQTTLASQSESYTFVRTVKRLFSPADWPDELTGTLNALAKIASQQLIFLLQLERPNNELRSLIIFIKGDVVGKSYLSKLARNTVGLNSNDQYWLETGKGRTTGATEDAIGESALAQFDIDLAHLCRAVDTLSQTLEAAQQAFENEADMLPNVTASLVRRYLERSGIANRRASILFERRGLSVSGRIGEVLEFDPTFHEPSGNAIGEKMVRVSAKAVERALSDTQKVTIIKAEVDQA
jgi:hypothetical protein